MYFLNSYFIPSIFQLQQIGTIYLIRMNVRKFDRLTNDARNDIPIIFKVSCREHKADLQWPFKIFKQNLVHQTHSTICLLVWLFSFHSIAECSIPKTFCRMLYFLKSINIKWINLVYVFYNNKILFFYSLSKIFIYFRIWFGYGKEANLTETHFLHYGQYGYSFVVTRSILDRGFFNLDSETKVYCRIKSLVLALFIIHIYTNYLT